MNDYKKLVEKYGTDEQKDIEYKIADEKYYNFLFEKIRKGETIDFSKTYFDGFSLEEYREKYGLNKTDVIKIYVDNAMLSIFDGSTNKVDFSFIQFIPSDLTAGVSFNSSIFVGGTANFSYSDFTNGDLTFDKSIFLNCTLKLVYCSNIKDLTFINATKRKSPFIIYGLTTHNGDIDFSELNCITKNGINGDKIIIEKCNFFNSSIKFNNNKSSGCDDYIYFIDNKFNLKEFTFDNSYFYGIVFFKCIFNCNVVVEDCASEYFILQECILHDIFKIIHTELPTNYDIKFCFLNTIFNGYFDMDNDIPRNFLINQKKLNINYTIDYENQDKNRFNLDDTSYLEKSMQANNLSEIFSGNGKFNKQDKAYSLSRRYRNFYRVQDKIYCLKSIKYIKEPTSVFYRFGLYLMFSLQLLLSSFIFIFEFILLDVLLGNYATNPLKFLAWLVVIIIGFGIAITFSCDLSQTKLVVNIPQSMSNIKISMLISLTNFFQVDLIDGDQNYILYIISMIEKILGMIILAIFTVSYTRKVIK